MFVRSNDTLMRRNYIMAWTKPIIREIECGMEINMYGPEEDGVLF